MFGLRLAGALWIIACLTCSGLLLFVFVGENLADLGILLQQPTLPALVLGGAIVSLLIGVVLIVRPGPVAVRSSTVAGVVWLVAFGSLALRSVGDPGPLLSSSMITGFGVAGALLAYRSRSTERPY